MIPPPAAPEPEEPPGVPGFRTWRGVYLFAGAVFALHVFLLALLTRLLA